MLCTLPPLERPAFMALLALADAVWINSLIDGLCFVPKEYVAVRAARGLSGRVILSRHAGAALEMPEAFIVDPFRREETAETVHDALTADEQGCMRAFRALWRTVSSRDLDASLLELLPCEGADPHTPIGWAAR